MKTPARRTDLSRLAPWLILAAIYAGIFCVSCRLTVTADVPARHGDTSIAAAVFGDARTALSSHFYETADLYFHRGVAHRHKQAFEDTFLQRLHEDISPSEHVHAEGQSVREIMPWLWMSIRMDPSNVETYLVASFWLAGEAGRPDLAIKVLTQGQSSNPRNYEIQLAKGRIYLREGDIAGASAAFDAALAFLRAHGDEQGEGPRIDKAEAMLYRALIYEVDREYAKGAVLLREIVGMFPERATLLTRIESLEQGRQPDLLAESIWNDMLHQYSYEKRSCDREDHDHEHGADGDSCEACRRGTD